MNWTTIILAIACFAGGWATNGWRLDAKAQAVQVTHLQETAAADQANSRKQMRMVDREAERTAALFKANDQALAKLKEKTHEVENLRNRVDAGDVRLRVAATCPGQANGSTQASTGAGLDSGGSAELDGSARPAYYALRQGIADTLGQLGACQQELILRTTP